MRQISNLICQPKLFLELEVLTIGPHKLRWYTRLCRVLGIVLICRSSANGFLHDCMSCQVALRSWLQQNFSSVVAMFEDRFELWTIQRLCNGGQVSEEEIRKSTEQGSQARKDEDPAQGIKLAVVQLSARRSKELRALTGWYFASSFPFMNNKHSDVPSNKTLALERNSVFCRGIWNSSFIWMELHHFLTCYITHMYWCVKLLQDATWRK